MFAHRSHHYTVVPHGPQTTQSSKTIHLSLLHFSKYLANTGIFFFLWKKKSKTVSTVTTTIFSINHFRIFLLSWMYTSTTTNLSSVCMYESCLAIDLVVMMHPLKLLCSVLFLSIQKTKPSTNPLQVFSKNAQKHFYPKFCDQRHFYPNVVIGP